MKRLLLVFALALLASASAWGQADTLRFASIAAVRQENAWLSGDNPAGLSLNPLRSFSVAQAGYAYRDGSFGVLGRPSSTEGYTVSAESFQQLGKASLYGLLNYTLHNRRGQSWNSMTNESWASVNLADSLPGRQRAEQYHLAGGLALPLHRRWTVGAQFDYQVQLTAKDTDPRNRNQWMEWQFTPGASYRHGHWRLGASLLYAVSKESVGIRNMGLHNTYPLFAAYPLGFFRTLPQEGEVNWYYRSHRMGAALQAHLTRGSVDLFQQFSGGIVRQEVESNRTQDRSEGETDGWQAAYHGRLQQQRGNTQHVWEGQVTLHHTRSYDPLQRRPDGGLWQTYGRVLRSTRREADAALTYRLRQMGSDLRANNAPRARYVVVAGIAYHHAATTLLFYPTEYSQPIHRLTLHAAFHRNIALPQGAQLDVSLGVQGGRGGGTLLHENAASSAQDAPSISLWQNEALRRQTYDYETGTRWGLTPTVGYTRPFARNAGSWFICLTGGYERAHNLPRPHTKEIVARMGWIF